MWAMEPRLSKNKDRNDTKYYNGYMGDGPKQTYILCQRAVKPKSTNDQRNSRLSWTTTLQLYMFKVLAVKNWL